MLPPLSTGGGFSLLGAIMDLRRLYQKETGQNSHRYICENGQESGRTDDYICWLESTCKLLLVRMERIRRASREDLKPGKMNFHKGNQ